MAIHGTDPLGNDEAIEELGALILIISERVDQGLDRMQTYNMLEQVTMVGVTTLRLLAETHPRAASIFLEKKRIEEWRRRYVAWLRSVESRLPCNYGEAMRNSAESEFERLLERAAF